MGGVELCELPLKAHTVTNQGKLRSNQLGCCTTVVVVEVTGAAAGLAGSSFLSSFFAGAGALAAGLGAAAC